MRFLIYEPFNNEKGVAWSIEANFESWIHLYNFLRESGYDLNEVKIEVIQWNTAILNIRVRRLE